MLEPAVSDLLPARQGLANTLVAPAELAPRARIVWLRPVESVRQREALWSKIVSGDRPGSL
jgi:putative spermidine/putrescine transport system substrate-binding protein